MASPIRSKQELRESLNFVLSAAAYWQTKSIEADNLLHAERKEHKVEVQSLQKRVASLLETYRWWMDKSIENGNKAKAYQDDIEELKRTSEEKQEIINSLIEKRNYWQAKALKELN